MSWVVVKFVESDEVEAVPFSWFDEKDQICWYPIMARSSLEKAIKCNTPPDKARWTKYTATKMSKTVYSNFNVASAKATKACLTSDISDSELLPPIRQRKPVIMSSDDSLMFPDMPLQLAKPENEINSCKKRNDPLRETETELESRSTRIAAQTSIKTRNEPVMETETKLEYETNVIKYLVTHKANLKIIEKDINMLKDSVDETKCLLKNILEIITKEKTGEAERLVEKISILEKFPIINFNVLEEVERDLCNKNCYLQLVQYLTRFGGLNYKDCVKRFFRKLLSDNVCQYYSMVGHKGKKPFANTKLFSIIADAVKKADTNVSVRQIEIYAALYLTKAKERLNKKKDKENENENCDV